METPRGTRGPLRVGIIGCGRILPAHLDGLRRLKERGTSFERLLVEVRRQRMLQLLAQRGLSVEAVAHATGYRDPSSFHRAFRAWTGVTPAVYRARLKAGVIALDATVAPRAVKGPLRPRK